MALNEQLMTDLKAAMRAKDTVTRDTLRMLKSDLGAESVRLGRELEEKEEVAVLQRAVKSRRDAIEAYQDGGRADSAAKEQQEIEVIERYLPKQLSEEETRRALEAIRDELGLNSKKEMGQLMKELKTRHGATIDMRVASKLAGALLS